MSDIILSEKKKVNIFDRIIQTVVIFVNMNKMNKSIEEHLNKISKQEDESQKEYEQNILKEIVFVKYQYDIMQRSMYELKMPYSDEVVENINSTDKTERLKLQKQFLETEYDRVTRIKFKTKEDIKYYLLIISSVIDSVKQDIKDEGKNKRYNSLIKVASEIDTKLTTGEYTEKDYTDIFSVIDDYVGYINDNYDIARLPVDERELIEFVIETMLSGIQSDIDKHTYEFKILVNICKNAYRYFKIVDEVFNKIINIYNESLSAKVMDIKDYIRMYKEVYDLKIKTKVNDVHRTIKTEDEYLEYTKLVTTFMYDELDEFILNRALENDCVTDDVKSIINKKLNIVEKNAEDVAVDFKDEEVKEDANIELEKIDIKEESKVKSLVKKVTGKLKKDTKDKKTKKDSKEEKELKKKDSKDKKSKKSNEKKAKKLESLDDVLKGAEKKEISEKEVSEKKLSDILKQAKETSEKQEEKMLIKKLKTEMLEHARELQKELEQEDFTD